MKTHHKVAPRTDCTAWKITAISNDTMGCLIAARKRQDGILLTLIQNSSMSKLKWNSSNHLPKQIQSIKTDQKSAKQFLAWI